METKPMRIEYIEDDEGDWRELILNGETFAANHSIHSSEWIALIEEITGIEVIVTNIPCEAVIIEKGLTMGKHKKKKKSDKKSLPMRQPVELQFEPTIPIEIINAAVDKALQRYKKRG